MDNVDLRETSGVVLAYLGDSIWELNIRKYWISKGLNLRNLNRKVNNINRFISCAYIIYTKADFYDNRGRGRRHVR